MAEYIKKVILAASPAIDFVLAPFVLIGSVFFKLVRKYGISRLNMCRWVFQTVGVLPVTDHYYDPFFRKGDLRFPLNKDRELHGIDLNTREQLELIQRFQYGSELVQISRQPESALEFYYDNPAFLSGDAEFLYNIVRYFKPRKLVEVGSGFSSLMAHKAMEINRQEDGSCCGELICIEPFEHRWLDDLGVKVLRSLVQDVDLELFRSLDRNDILFIDSSHIIKPQSDVLFLYLEVLPSLNPGVLIHIHDIFTPRDYPEQWVIRDIRFWNEQYLLEAFLSFNSNFKVIGALNYLMHHHTEELLSVCPVLKQQMGSREPGSFWIQKVR